MDIVLTPIPIEECKDAPITAFDCGMMLYVTCARDHLVVMSVRPASEFLDDLRK